MSVTIVSPKRAATLAVAATLVAGWLNISASPVQATPAAPPLIGAAAATPIEVTIPAKRLPARQYAIPEWVRGDRDFAGHGPRVVVGADLSYTSKAITLRLSMTAEETTADHTTAAGAWRYTLYRAPIGQCITDVLVDPHEALRYVDTDPAPDVFPGEDLVDQYKVVGDTAGDDAGVTTGVAIWTNKFPALMAPC